MWYVDSSSGTRVSAPASSNRHNCTASAPELHNAKFVPSPSQLAPSGCGCPGHGRMCPSCYRPGGPIEGERQVAGVHEDVVVQLSGVGVRRGTTDLVAGIDWTVELDERWVVLGPNGAGKTTLLQLAAAQLYPTVGAVHVL